MKRILLAASIILACFVVSGCGQSDYQHPAKRSGAV